MVVVITTIITAIVTIIIGIIGSKWFNEYMAQKLGGKTPDNSVKVKFINHNIFTTIEEVRQDIKRANFFIDKDEKIHDITKETMFVDFMNNKLNAIGDQTKTFIEKEDNLVKLSKTELANSVMVLVNNIISEYTIKTKEDFINNGVKVADADYIIDLFEEWRYDTVKAMKHRLESLFSSEFHTTNHSIILGLLEVFSFSILLIPKDGILSFNVFNGKFAKLKYKSKY